MRGKISITDNGTVTVTGEVRMNIGEIADLFGIYYKAAKMAIRAIEKSGIACGDTSTGSTVERLKVYPDYYGLDMVIAVAFRVQAPFARHFRKWVVAKSFTADRQPILLQYNSSASIN